MGLLNKIVGGLLSSIVRTTIKYENNTDEMYSHVGYRIGRGEDNTKNKRRKGSNGPSFCAGGFGPSFEDNDK